ncbi:unnamed protein product [Vitrella brassicaformis CCMP3155]|uniref:Uncharacterized protein n=1 Tax=Vitrella brassicaformis (strain CCMP3155) TaxID=1169540 RepID=A0A0G4E8X5_VITBC|nr:unnamed protein product [Vitrella brassicaformis CCMP3155]|eukprot:CEL91960.1 unnamed protein product [Vitrella brassicaformis CCMP3155]
MGMPVHRAAEGRPPYDAVFDIYGVSEGDRKSRHVLYERRMLVEWEQHYKRIIERPSPVEQLRDEGGFEWVGPWLDTLSTIREREA